MLFSAFTSAYASEAIKEEDSSTKPVRVINNNTKSKLDVCIGKSEECFKTTSKILSLFVKISDILSKKKN